jgi:hypothetical protein
MEKGTHSLIRTTFFIGIDEKAGGRGIRRKEEGRQGGKES